MREKKVYPTYQRTSFVLDFHKDYDIIPTMCCRMLKRIGICYMLGRFFRKKKLENNIILALYKNTRINHYIIPLLL